MKIVARAGDHIRVVAQRAVDLVASGEPVVTFDFNGTEVVVKEGMSADAVSNEFMRVVEERHAAYVLTPEYLEGERRRTMDDKIKRRLLAALLAKSPTALTLRDAKAWDALSEVNTSPYGAAALNYAERWARLMEGAMAEGISLEACASDLSFVADNEGLTGFMQSFATNALCACWVHGEELRKWHEKTWGEKLRGGVQK